MMQTIKLSGLTNWSVQYLLQNTFSYNEDYKLIKIGDFLTRNKTGIEIQDGEIYKRVTIKVRNGGVFLRDSQKGENIGTKKQFTVKEGQFLLSKIDARNGAFGVVPNEVNNAIITGNFWTFDVNYDKINPHFLALIVTTPEFIQFCENASNGTTNRHYLQEELFLEQKIPLPPKEEQDRIVATYNQKITLAERQEEKAKQLEQDIETYLFDALGIEKLEKQQKTKGLNFINFEFLDIWGADRLLRGGLTNILQSKKYPNKKLGQLVEVNPKTNLNNLDSNDQMSFIPMKHVSDDYGVVTKKDKGLKSKSKGYTKFQDGDLIWARITPCMQNGKSAIVNNLHNGVGYGSTEYHVLRQINENYNIDFVYHLLRTKSILNDAVNHFTGSAGQQRVPKSYLENLLVPVPPIETQTQIANHISSLKAQIKKLKEKAGLNRTQAITDFEKEIFS